MHQVTCPDSLSHMYIPILMRDGWTLDREWANDFVIFDLTNTLFSAPAAAPAPAPAAAKAA